MVKKKKVVAKKAPAKKSVNMGSKAKKAPAKKAPAKKKSKAVVEDVNLRMITPPFVISFPNLFKPKISTNGKEEYKATMYFDKDSTDMSKIQACIDQVIRDEFKGKKVGLNPTIRDGDDTSDTYSEYEGTENCWILSAKTVFKPGLVDSEREDIIDPSVIYSGCVCRASVTFYGYNVDGNKGVGLALNNLQFLTDGEPLGDAGIKADKEFEDAEDAEYEEYEEEADGEEPEDEEEVEENEENEENEEEEEGIEVYTNEDGVEVYIDEEGDEVEYNEEDFE